MIEVGHLSWEPEGLIIVLPKSKTDQEGKGMLRTIPYGNKSVCPVTSLKVWLAESAITSESYAPKASILIDALKNLH